MNVMVENRCFSSWVEQMKQLHKLLCLETKLNLDGIGKIGSLNKNNEK